VSDPAGPIQDVSDTARWVAVYRAMESERPDAHFRDPYARRLAGERGEAIVRAMPDGRRMAWPMIVRTCLLDEMITRLVEREGADAVVNLAAGLDARPWRMRLPAGLRWYDVDLPAMLAYKGGILANERPACVLESRAVDLTRAPERRALLEEIGRAHRSVVVVSEGLLIYLDDEQVAALGRDLHALPAFRWWLADLVSPPLLRLLERSWGARLRAGNAPMRFAPVEGTRFFEPLGWREAEYRSTWEEAGRLGRDVPLGWFWRFVARFASSRRREEWGRYSGVVRLERIPS
jgi:methyltransferase (TIGR00027 family)